MIVTCCSRSRHEDAWWIEDGGSRHLFLWATTGFCMSDNESQGPPPWAPGESGALIIELDNDGTPLRLCTFRRRRGEGRSDSWHVFDVCELRGIDYPPLSGEIQSDGGFSFHITPDESAQGALVAFIEATDSRLHFEDDGWVFE